MYEKIMYKNHDNHVEHAIPRDFDELKILVEAGFCVMNWADLDFFDLYKDADWFMTLNLSDLKNKNWRDIPSINIKKAFKLLKKKEFFHYNIVYDDIIEEVDLEDDYARYVENNTTTILQDLIYDDDWYFDQ